MQHNCKLAGLNHIPTIKTNNLDEILTWKHRLNLDCIVLKPMDGGGSVDVHFCYTDKQVEMHFNSLIRKTNVFGNAIENVLAQEKINGLQYIVNTVSNNGFHRIIDIWEDHRIEKKDQSYIPNFEKLIEYENIMYDRVVDYCNVFLNKISFNQGPAHIELIIQNKTNEIFLIEIGARIQGFIDDKPVKDYFGTSQLSATTSLLIHSSFLKPKTPKNKQFIYSVFFIGHKETYIYHDKFYEEVRRLKTLNTIHSIPRCGNRVYETIDLLSANGMVYLSSDDETEILKDIEAIRKLEEKHLR